MSGVQSLNAKASWVNSVARNKAMKKEPQVRLMGGNTKSELKEHDLMANPQQDHQTVSHPFEPDQDIWKVNDQFDSDRYHKIPLSRPASFPCNSDFYTSDGQHGRGWRRFFFRTDPLPGQALSGAPRKNVCNQKKEPKESPEQSKL